MKINDAEISVTPKLVAEAFWNLDSVEQARFFEELHDLLVDRDWPAHNLGEMQWLYMANELQKSPKAKAMACALTASIFLRATDFLNRKCHQSLELLTSWPEPPTE